MSHELNMQRNGNAAMAYVGETPWHNLGQLIAEGAPIEQWIEAAGMAYQILGLQTTADYTDHNGRIHTITDKSKQVLFRDDTMQTLATVGSNFHVVQPREILEFFYNLSSEFDCSLETAGVLGNGQKYWALAKVNNVDGIEVYKGDITNQYLLLTTACDGSSATTARYTSIRVVCKNTLRFSNSKSNKGYEIKISHRSRDAISKIKNDLNLEQKQTDWENFAETMRGLYQVRVSPAQATEYFTRLLSPNSDDHITHKNIGAQSFEDLLKADANESINKNKTPRALKHVERVYLEGVGQQEIHGTAYGVLNAVTRFVDHENTARTVDAGHNKAWYGTGDTMKNDALQLVQEMFTK